MRIVGLDKGDVVPRKYINFRDRIARGWAVFFFFPNRIIIRVVENGKKKKKRVKKKRGLGIGEIKAEAAAGV